MSKNIPLNYLIPVLGLFLVTGFVSALPIFVVSETDFEEVEEDIALLRELKVVLKKLAPKALRISEVCWLYRKY